MLAALGSRRGSLAASSSPTPTSTTSPASPSSPGRRGAEVWAPAGEAAALRPARPAAAIAVAPHDARARSRGRRPRRARRARVRGRRRPGPLRDHVAFATEGAIFSGDLLFAARSAASTSRAATGTRCSPRSRACSRATAPTRSSTPATATRRRSGASSSTNPFLGELRAALMAERFQAPRGTHDILPGRGAALVGTIVARDGRAGRAATATAASRRPASRTRALFARTAGEASDVVQKEMYTFTDRSRPLADAPARGDGADLPRLRRARHAPRAAAGQAATRSRRCTATRRPRRAATASTGSVGRGDRLGRPGDRRRGDPALRRAARAGSASSRVELRLNSIGDAACRPAYVERLERLARRRTTSCSTTRRATSARTSPLQVFDVKNPALRAALAEAPRRSASRSAAPCREHFEARARLLEALRRPLHARSGARARARLLHAHDLRVRRARRARHSSICGGGRYDGLVEADRRARRRPGSGSAPASTGWRSRSSAEGARPRRAGARRLLRRSTARRAALVLELHGGAARRGLACDTDYAGRSLKGQLTQAERQRRADARDRPAPTDATVRRGGEPERRRGARRSSRATLGR